MQSLGCAWRRRPPIPPRASFITSPCASRASTRSRIFGGYIFCNYGTILASGNESELASVLAHETAHVTQRHLARAVSAQSQQGLEQAATILGAILIGVLAGGSGQAMEGASRRRPRAWPSSSRSISPARRNTRRTGSASAFSRAAGFDPRPWRTFFEQMSRREGLNDAWVPEMLRDHPVTSNRVAEARAPRRAIRAAASPSQSAGYALIKERLRVLTTPREELVHLYTAIGSEHEPRWIRSYGQALTLMASGRPGRGGRDPRAAGGPAPGQHAAVRGARPGADGGQGDHEGLTTFEPALDALSAQRSLTSVMPKRSCPPAVRSEAHTAAARSVQQRRARRRRRSG